MKTWKIDEVYKKHDLAPSISGRVGDGWADAIDRLIVDLIALGWDKDLHQVKEKFGDLRFYVGGASDEMHARIAQAEKECSTLCETCGKPGDKEGGTGWVKTQCKEHKR